MSAKVKFQKLGVELRAKGQKGGPLDVDSVKEFLGWEEEPEGKDWGEDYLFKDLNKKKVRLNNNNTNRPFRRTLAKRYASEILRKKWRVNGETFVVDRFGKVQDGQHRGVGLVFAEQERQSDKEYWAENYGWKTAVAIDALLVSGISDKSETVDTLGLGQKRSLGDVIFRRKEFKTIGEKDQKRLANILSGAVRLVWIRTGGKSVSDAPWFPHSEALEFLESHPGIVEAVETVFKLEGGGGADGKKISRKLSLSYAAGLLYLMGTCGTDPDKFEDGGKVDRKHWKKAKEFWSSFADPDELGKGSPIMAVRNALERLDASGAMARDEIIGTVVKAFNAFLDGKKVSSVKDVKVKRTKNKETGKIELGEDPRLGGLDRVPAEEPEEEDEPAAEAPVRGKRSGKTSTATKGWRVKDTCWVIDKDDPEGCWFGSVKGFSDDKKVAWVTAKEDGKDYETPVDSLSIDKPQADEYED